MLKRKIRAKNENSLPFYFSNLQWGHWDRARLMWPSAISGSILDFVWVGSGIEAHKNCEENCLFNSQVFIFKNVKMNQDSQFLIFRNRHSTDACTSMPRIFLSCWPAMRTWKWATVRRVAAVSRSRALGWCRAFWASRSEMRPPLCYSAAAKVKAACLCRRAERTTQRRRRGSANCEKVGVYVGYWISMFGWS